MKNNIIRLRAQFIEEGEKPTRCFCGLESSNYTNKSITSLEYETGKVITDQTEIFQETRFL